MSVTSISNLIKVGSLLNVKKYQKFNTQVFAFRILDIIFLLPTAALHVVFYEPLVGFYDTLAILY